MSRLKIFILDQTLISLMKLYNNRVVRFFLVSGLNTLFGYSTFFLITVAGIEYEWALLFSTVIGIIFNFKTIGILVFKNKRNILIFKFFLVYGITYLFNLGGLKIFEFLGISVYWGAAILLVPAGLLTYTLNSKFVFSYIYKNDVNK